MTAPSKALIDLHSPAYVISGAANAKVLLVEQAGIEPASKMPLRQRLWISPLQQF